MLRLLFCWLTNRQPKAITTASAPEAARWKPARAERKGRGQKDRDRYAEIAAALKADAGVTEHIAHKKMSGRASLATGHNLAPAGVTRQQLYVVAHECAHIALHSAPKRRRRPRHIEEHEAESYAHRALTAHGLEVPVASTHWALGYVGQCIEEDRAKGIPICPMAEAFASGRRSPYASLPAVDAHRRRKTSAPATIGCATCRYRASSCQAKSDRSLPATGQL